jgi:hypothetical protein
MKDDEPEITEDLEDAGRPAEPARDTMRPVYAAVSYAQSREIARLEHRMVFLMGMVYGVLLALWLVLMHLED